MTTTSIRFPSGDLTLEGILHEPGTGPSAKVVVVCHPHPQRGGDMRNNVVGMIVRALNEAGISALAFNFRGVGSSEGNFDDGDGEQDDVRAALDYARGLDGIEDVALAGYSFGAGMAARMVDASIPRLALVALPTRSLESPALQSFAGPILFATGSLDEISSLDAVHAKAIALGEHVSVAGVSGADHFWWGKDQELVEAVREFFEGWE